MVLVDTSVWIDFFAGRDLLHVLRLETLIRDQEDLCICPLILTEVLQGIRDDGEFKNTQGLFETMLFLPMEKSTYVLAARLYRDLRKKGFSIRKTNDCLIAAVAVEHDVPLLHHDRDFDVLAKHSLLCVL